jgi:hypothetical protein
VAEAGALGEGAGEAGVGAGIIATEIIDVREALRP